MSEIELKFLVDEKVAKRLASRLRDHAIDETRPKKRPLRSIYFDTEDLALHKAGYSARLRRDGRRWIQTVKTRKPVRNGLSKVDEFETPVSKKKLNIEAVGDAAARKNIEMLIGSKSLKPVCETAMKRLSGTISDGNGTRAEMSIDVGKIVAGKRQAAFCEAELELIDGDLGSLYGLADEMLGGSHYRFSRLSKSERGYLLASDGTIQLPARPRKAKKVAISSKTPVSEALTAIFRECLEQISVNIDAVGDSDDPEGPHQLRIGLRRLRSAIEMFRPVIPYEQRRRFEREARWLGRKVGGLRDRDVAIIDVIEPEIKRHRDEKGLRLLRRRVRVDAKRVRRKVRHTLRKRRTRDLMLQLARFCEAAPVKHSSDGIPVESVDDLARRALDKYWGSVRLAAKDIETLSVDDRHLLRKRLKRLRYAIEFSAPLFDQQRRTEFLRRLKKLQTLFGNLNDAAMIGDLFEDGGIAGCDGSEAQRAIGLVVGGRLAEAHADWANAKVLWAALELEGPFWTAEET